MVSVGLCVVGELRVEWESWVWSGRAGCGEGELGVEVGELGVE